MQSNQYFATKSADDLASDLQEKMINWSSWMNRSGMRNKWMRSYNLYYGRHFSGAFGQYNDTKGAVLEGGDNGELKLLTVNHYRNILKHILALTTNLKPSFDVRAINTDSKSMQQARLGNNILDAYLKEKRLFRYIKNAAEHAQVFGKGFVEMSWEPTLGRPYMVDHQVNPGTGEKTPKITYEGDVEISTPSVLDVFVDQTLEDWTKLNWYCSRSWRNKFDLAARHPDISDKILSLQSKNDMNRNLIQSFQNLDETSDVPVYKFYHKRTDAMPNGRYTLFCADGVVLYDGPIPYKKLPLFRIVPGEIAGTTEGYSDGFDLQAPQEALNTLMSTIFSNESAFGVQNILVPNGCNLSGTMIGKGLRVLKYDQNAGKPEALQLTNTPAEIFKFAEILERTMETLSGVNSVARGNPESSIKSGVALSLIQSMAVQYSSNFQQSWAELLEDCGGFILELLKDFAKTERMVAQAGKMNRAAMRSFTKDDLQSIDRVVVDLGNGMSRTTSGRLQIGDNLLDKNMIQTPQEYIQVLNTGNLDPMIQGKQASLDAISQENEMLLDGKPVMAIVGEPHNLHMQEHMPLLANPDIKMNEQLVKNVVDHIQQHMNLYKTQDPLWSIMSGEPPAPQPPPPPPQQQGGQPHPGLPPAMQAAPQDQNGQPIAQPPLPPMPSAA